MTNGNQGRMAVAVMFGGRSVEHEISIISALQLIEAMDTSIYNPIPVYISPDGKWYTGEALLKRQFYKNMPASLSEVEEAVLLPVPGIGGLSIIKGKAKTKGFFQQFGKSQSDDNIIPIDVYFPVFHGSYGEDGCVQGLFEMADVAYTGCDVVSSAVGMSKYHCKKFLESHGIPVLPSVVLNKEQLGSSMGGNLGELRQRVLATPGLEKYPLFVKPASLGSSIGIAKAADGPSLDAALLQAFKYDWQAIVEPCVEKKLEINVSVLDDGEPRVSVVEIPVPSGEELSYEDKYIREGGKKSGDSSQGMAGLTRVIDPADLDPTMKAQAQDYAVRAFKLLGCAGVARLDFMLDTTTNILYFNEINTLPGSMANYLWVKSKPPLLFTDMITHIIKRAIEHKQRKSALARGIGFKALFK
jgi:D-alanine-D-alanine ligase